MVFFDHYECLCHFNVPNQYVYLSWVLSILRSSLFSSVYLPPAYEARWEVIFSVRQSTGGRGYLSPVTGSWQGPVEMGVPQPARKGVPPSLPRQGKTPLPNSTPSPCHAPPYLPPSPVRTGYAAGSTPLAVFRKSTLFKHNNENVIDSCFHILRSVK